MAFPIQVLDAVDSGILRGNQEPVAVDCWFTQGGRTIPRSAKYMDQQGEIHKIEHITVITSDDKRYNGSDIKEIYCQAAHEGRMYYFKLIFYKERNVWSIIWI